MLEKPKPWRREAEATNTRTRKRNGKHRSMRQPPSANTKVSSCTWRRRTRAVRRDASEARAVSRELATKAVQHEATGAGRDIDAEAGGTGELFPRPNT